MRCQVGSPNLRLWFQDSSDSEDLKDNIEALRYYLREYVVNPLRRGENIEEDAMEKLRFSLRCIGWECDDEVLSMEKSLYLRCD